MSVFTHFSTLVFATFTMNVELFLLSGADSISSNVSFVSHIVSSFLLLSIECLYKVNEWSLFTIISISVCTQLSGRNWCCLSLGKNKRLGPTRWSNHKITYVELVVKKYEGWSVNGGINMSPCLVQAIFFHIWNWRGSKKWFKWVSTDTILRGSTVWSWL